MKKTKLFTSLVALALVVGLGACEGDININVGDVNLGGDESSESETSSDSSEDETSSETSSEGNTGGNPSEGGDSGQGVSTYKLGAADPDTGVYYYFDGTALTNDYGNSYLNVTTSWDDAIDVAITDLASGGQSLSFVDSEGDTKYISWSSSTNVDFSDEAYAWYWTESINGYYNLADGTDTSGRFLGLLASNPSFRAYSPTTQYLAYGHVAAYETEPEPITPDEPETGTEEFPFEVGTDYFLGYDRDGTKYYYNGEVLNTYYGDVSTDISKAAKVTLGATGDKYTLKLENGYYLGAEFGDKNNFKWDLTTAYEWEYNSTYQTFVAYNASGTAYCLGTSGTYNEITVFTLSSAASNHPATLYEIPEGWEPYEEPEIDENSFTEVMTGKLGLFQENKDSYYYFTGTKDTDDKFGAMSTSWEEGVEVTLLTDDTYYFIRFVSNDETLYFGHTDKDNSQVAFNSDPYPLQYDETYGAYLNTDGSRYVGTYSTYETLSWSTVSYLGQEGQFIATIYETEPESLGGDEGGDEGDKEDIFPYELGKSYWLGFNMSNVDYYFDGTVYNTNYGGVTDDTSKAVWVTINEYGDGYSLSFVDDSGTTQYIYMNDSSYFKWRVDPYAWSYDSTYDTFTAQNASGTQYFIGTYGTYKDLCCNEYGYLTGDKSTSNAQYPAHLYEIKAPTALYISGADTLSAGLSTQLTVTANAGEYAGATWSSSNEEYATVDETGLVTGVAEGEVTIYATSTLDPTIVGSHTMTIEAKAEGTRTLDYTYTFASGNGITTSGGTVTLGGLQWTTTSAVYIGGEYSGNSRGLQIGSSNSAQTTPWTISTDFGEDVTLTSVAINVVGASSSSGANFTITHGDTTVANAVSFSTTAKDYEYANLEVSGSKLSISMVCTAKAMYLKYINFSIVVGPDSTLNW